MRITLPEVVRKTRERQQRRAKQWQLRRLAGEVSRYKEERIQACGWKSVLPNGDVVARGGRRPDLGESAGLAGLATCGSGWRCPCCGAKIAYVKAEDLGWVLVWAVMLGYTVAMVTLTMRHSAGHPLADLLKVGTSAWGTVTSGHRWIDIANQEQVKKKNRFGGKYLVDNPDYDPRLPTILGWSRLLEVTHGWMNGFHPHYHVILVFKDQVSPAMVREVGSKMYDTWEKVLAKKGKGGEYTPLREFGYDIRVSTEQTEEALARYFVKNLSFEATGGQTKKGHGDHRSMFEVLADYGETRDPADLKVWNEYERAIYGKQQLTWSEDLRDMAGLAEKERTDEEIAAEEIGGSEDLLQLPAETWRAIRPFAYQLLDVIELEGLVGAERWLRKLKLAYGVISMRGVAPP